jgi:hypothetical protein
MVNTGHQMADGDLSQAVVIDLATCQTKSKSARPREVINESASSCECETNVNTLWIDASISGAIGAVVGSADLLRRYKQPASLPFRTVAGWSYILINLLAAGLALVLTRVVGWDPGTLTGAGGTSARLIQILAAGFGALGLLRSPTFTSVADDGSSSSPGSVLSIFLGAADRQVTLKRSVYLVEQAAKLTRGLRFEEISIALPTTVLSTLDHSLSSDDQLDLRKAVDALSVSDLSNAVKCISLVRLLINISSLAEVTAALATLREGHLAQDAGDLHV